MENSSQVARVSVHSPYGVSFKQIWMVCDRQQIPDNHEIYVRPNSHLPKDLAVIIYRDKNDEIIGIAHVDVPPEEEDEMAQQIAMAYAYAEEQ